MQTRTRRHQTRTPYPSPGTGKHSPQHGRTNSIHTCIPMYSTPKHNTSNKQGKTQKSSPDRTTSKRTDFHRFSTLRPSDNTRNTNVTRFGLFSVFCARSRAGNHAVRESALRDTTLHDGVKSGLGGLELRARQPHAAHPKTCAVVPPKKAFEKHIM